MSITLKQRLLSFVSQGLKFGAVGALGFVVDFTVFNLLRTTVLDSADVHAGPIYAKVISTVLAFLVSLSTEMLVLVGILIAATARRWPGSTRRYNAVAITREDGNPIDDWDSLSEGRDPTGGAEEGTRGAR